MKYSRFNIIYLLQRWMDSVAGQTFLNYAYSWGASVVILGTLFKLTHLPYADAMLYIGMGTEVVVFFLSAFDRPFDKTQEGLELTNGSSSTSQVRDDGVTKELLASENVQLYKDKLRELATMLDNEKDSVAKMIEQSSVCVEDMKSLSENIRKIDSVAGAVARAIDGKH